MYDYFTAGQTVTSAKKVQPYINVLLKWAEGFATALLSAVDDGFEGTGFTVKKDSLKPAQNGLAFESRVIANKGDRYVNVKVVVEWGVSQGAFIVTAATHGDRVVPVFNSMLLDIKHNPNALTARLSQAVKEFAESQV